MTLLVKKLFAVLLLDKKKLPQKKILLISHSLGSVKGYPFTHIRKLLHIEVIAQQGSGAQKFKWNCDLLLHFHNIVISIFCNTLPQMPHRKLHRNAICSSLSEHEAMQNVALLLPCTFLEISRSIWIIITFTISRALSV